MMELFVVAILLTATGAQQHQLGGPENTLGFVGSTITLKCSTPSKNCSGIDWQKYVKGASPITVFKGPRQILSVVDRARYSVNNSLGCDLVIRNVNLTDAGRFICSAILSSSQITKSANLIILRDRSKCTTTASQDNTAERDIVRMTCEVTYNGSASIVWNGVTDAPDAVNSGTTISRSHTIVASAPEVPSFTCATSFAFETADNYGAPIAGLATNIPVISCVTPVIKVMYSVRNVTLLPSLSYYSPGNVINCTAKGRPLPTCKWQEMKNGSTWTDAHNQNGCRFTMPSISSKKYRCLAMNVVRGRSYNATSHEIGLPINNTGSDYNDSSSALTMFTIFFGLPLWIWVASGGGAVILLLIIILVICCCCRACPCYKCCHSEKKLDDEIGLRDGQSPLGSPVYSTVNPTTTVLPKTQPTCRRDRPVPPAPTSPSKRQPAPPPLVKERTDNRKAGRKKQKAEYLDLKE